MGLWDVVVPVVSVVVTGGVAVWSKIIDARSKREDRQHAGKLDYEQRVWRAKNDVLRRLISACRFVKWRAQLTGAENKDEKYRRAATIRALSQFRERIGNEDGVSEITAYAAQPVRDALDEMLEEVNVQFRALLTSMWIGERVVWGGAWAGRLVSWAHGRDLGSMALIPIDPGAVRARINPTQRCPGAARCAGRQGRRRRRRGAGDGEVAPAPARVPEVRLFDAAPLRHA